MIEVTNLTKQYGDHIAVNNLSFKVEKGQIYGFLGPNGAGKSTTMNIITGYLAPTDGTVTIDGKDIQKEPEAAKKLIGYLPEIPPLYTEMSVRDFLKFEAELKKVPKAERKQQVDEVMEMTQITDMQNRLIKNLSKGYRQRVGIAQAILGKPEVIILDEPSVGLDPKQIIEIRDLIRKLGEKHTVILSSHILSEVQEVCDHILIIAHGKLVASDTTENLSKLTNPNTILNLTVSGDFDAAKAVLENVAGVDSLENGGTDADGNTLIKVVSAKGVDVRDEAGFALAGARIAVRSMQIEEKSLEDIFLELTDGGEEVKKERKRLFKKKDSEEATDETADEEVNSKADADSENINGEGEER